MSAIDTFEWFLSFSVSEPEPGMREQIRRQRDYLLSLRSEDERQRFVESVIENLRRS